MRKLNDFELGYLVGIFEGEGYFIIRKERNKVHARCGIEMCDKDVIEKVRDIVDCTMKIGEIRKKKPRKTQFSFIINGIPAIELSDKLYQYLSIRRQWQIIRMKTLNGICRENFESFQKIEEEFKNEKSEISGIKEGD